MNHFGLGCAVRIGQHTTNQSRVVRDSCKFSARSNRNHQEGCVADSDAATHDTRTVFEQVVPNLGHLILKNCL